ncbi:hypothetical protein [Cellulosimicrobium sp. NPDC057862]|uniref:hypothetical protein n=1 Tax=Actinomycetes TaxID=1760 RepID=UPI00367259DD
MTLYGFRLHTIELTEGRSRTKLAITSEGLDRFLPEGVSSPQALVAARLRAMQGTMFIRDATYKAIGEPVRDAADWPERTPCLRIDSVAEEANRIEVGVTYGRKGAYPTAMRFQGGEDISLDDAAAARGYRVLLYFPRAGDRAVMVSEVVGRTHVGQALMQRLSVENAAAAALTKGDGETVDPWLRFVPRGMFDESRIAEVLEEGAIEGLTLKRHAAQSSGVRRTKDLVLTQNGLPESKRGQAKKLVAKWVKKSLGIADLSADERSVGALLEFVDVDDGAVADIGFTDGSFRFSEHGKSQSLGPTNLEKILMYPTGDQRLSTPDLHGFAVKRLRPLTESLTLPIEFV